jgi:beta-glucanase (GH16 family)
MRFLLNMMCCAAIIAGVVQAEEWELVWSEEFEYEGMPDKSKWDYEEGFVRNEEMQYYTRERRENVRVQNGLLIIEGRREDAPNPKHDPNSMKWQKQRQSIRYTSGSINTLGKASFQYGRIEVRAKVPQGRGVWPAIWMMGVNRAEVGWPRCGEIDIMEYVGKDPHRIHANNHFAYPRNKNKAVHKSAGGGKITIREPYKNFHVYAIEWNEKEIRFFVDEERYATFNLDLAGKGADNPFRKPHYLLLNLALGGRWGGAIDDNMLPQKYEIDYIRVYKEKTDR